ncbi:MAG: UDP-N-acetylglucosamine 1-carboxyvinyltransferase [Caldicoprobacterales bacterium]|nr:UDP-N-acetylglucosamine 1-carboxyvinyltransferase [Clostridiales bacterium]
MEKFYIRGGKPLTGTVTIGGAKNAVVAIMPAALLADESCTIDNLPYIDDVITLADILEEVGAKVSLSTKGRITIDGSTVTDHKAPYDMVKRMRASYYLLGVLLGKFGKAEIPLPGGCEIGARPIDQHIKGFEALGAKVEIEHGIVRAEAKRLIGNEIYLDVVSVGATINIMLAAVKAEGLTTIVNAAKEPHVVDVANFLNCMGAKVKGAGTDTIRIKGVDKLSGCEYTIIPDQIEAGTFMIAAAATNGDVIVANVIPKHLESVTAKLLEMGIEVIEGDDYVRVKGISKPRKVNIKTLPYPGFPTDLQQPISVLCSIAEGTSIIHESLFDHRFRHVEELSRMGAKIKVEDRVAIFEGVDGLTGALVSATDLRAGAALIIAGLVAEGVTEVDNIHFIDRGYERIERKLAGLNADIKRLDDGQSLLKAVSSNVSLIK